MSGFPWEWSLFIGYLVVTAALAWRGGRTATGKAGFAIGTGTMSPWIAGMTLGACLASSAMFVIMPGFVYADGLPALIGFSLPLIAGLASGLLLMAPRFQAIGADASALTIPHWLGARYDSPGLRRLFSGLNILNVAYLVLVAVGCAYICQTALGLPYAVSVVGIVVFVFGYTGFGGAGAHALTNTLQGVIMLGMTVVIVASGVQWWLDGSLLGTLADSGTVAEGSALFSTSLEVWLVPFIMGMALTTQPHLMTKALYVRDRAALKKTILIGMITFSVFCLVLLAGAYARIALPADIPQDRVMAEYLAVAFSFRPLAAMVSVAILAASMSTMDGLLVAIAASIGNDLLVGRGSVRLNQAILAGLAALTIAIAIQPPALVLILGQLGVYGLVAASAGPLLAGLFSRRPLDARVATASALLALTAHFSLSLLGVTGNPGIAAAVAMAISVPVAFVPTRRASAAAARLAAK